MKIIPLVLDKIHQDIFKPEIAQVLEFLEDVLNSSRYGDFQERSQLQKISDIIVSSKELNFDDFAELHYLLKTQQSEFSG